MHLEELLSYRYGDERIPLLDQSRGIRNPADFDSTLSIMTSANGPYHERVDDDGDVRYHYRAREGGDNRKLRPDLLDAAHIIADASLRGVPQVTNGLALCKINQAADDRNLLGRSSNWPPISSRSETEEERGHEPRACSCPHDAPRTECEEPPLSPSPSRRRVRW